MQLLITLKGIEDLSNHLPIDADKGQFKYRRLWNFSTALLEELKVSDDPLEQVSCIYKQMSFDLQCLYKTFEVTVGQGIDGAKLIEKWKTNDAILLVEII